MSRFEVDLVVANYEDIAAERTGRLRAEEVRRETIRGVVHSGAKHLVLPQKLVDHLGLPPAGTTNVRYADNRYAKRDFVEGVHVEIMRRHSTQRAIVEPKREVALIGAFVVEDLDFLIDCRKQKLIPRHPKGELSEIE
jgi:predicted aspartyl protease